VYVLAELKINGDSSILGLKFENLTDELCRSILLTTNIYLFIHFLWCAWDSFVEWRLRVTGTKLAYKTGFTISHDAEAAADHPDDQRQSTLYSWWKKQSTLKMGTDLLNNSKNFNSNIDQQLSVVHNRIVEINNKINELKNDPQINICEVLNNKFEHILSD
jgi:hypothetical protein